MANGNCGIRLAEKELMTKKTKISKILIIGNIKITLEQAFNTTLKDIIHFSNLVLNLFQV